MDIRYPVPPSEIQIALSRIWDSLESPNKMRACLFNLIFYVPRNPRLEYLRAVIQKVIEKFPSRIILVCADPNPEENYLKTEVAVIPAAKGSYDIACDFIEINVAGVQKEKTLFLLLSHILPDLPIYVVWAEDPAKEQHLSSQLKELATRMIFDSETIEDLPGFARLLLSQKKDTQCDIADLNWARMEGWRELLSNTFYSEERLSSLRNAQSIEIEYNAQPTEFYCHTKIQSIYLQAWLACQLGWQLSKVETTQNTSLFSYRKKNKEEVSISLIPITQFTFPSGAIASLNIKTKEGAHFSFSRNPKSLGSILTQFSTPEICEMPSRFIFAKTESGQSLVKEICHKGTSIHYINMLHSLAEMHSLQKA